MNTAHTHGQEAEAMAQRYLESRGLRLLMPHFRSKGGEVDLIMQDVHDTLIFVEVRYRRHAHFGGALASVDVHKQKRIVHASLVYLLRFTRPPPCRFDIVALQGPLPQAQLSWIKGAFSL